MRAFVFFRGVWKKGTERKPAEGARTPGEAGEAEAALPPPDGGPTATVFGTAQASRAGLWPGPPATAALTRAGPAERRNRRDLPGTTCGRRGRAGEAPAPQPPRRLPREAPLARGSPPRRAPRPRADSPSPPLTPAAAPQRPPPPAPHALPSPGLARPAAGLRDSAGRAAGTPSARARPKPRPRPPAPLRGGPRWAARCCVGGAAGLPCRPGRRPGRR